MYFTFTDTEPQSWKYDHKLYERTGGGGGGSTHMFDPFRVVARVLLHCVRDLVISQYGEGFLVTMATSFHAQVKCLGISRFIPHDRGDI